MTLVLDQAWGPSPLVLEQKPDRIVSLVPSVTETILDWGGTLVGRSSFCIFPESEVVSIDRVGGTKTPNHKRILALKPDLVIANLEENQKADIQSLQASGIPVWITYPEDMPSTLTYLRQLRQLCPNDSVQGDADIEAFEAFVQNLPSHSTNKQVAVLIWKDPWMAAGQQTYTHHLLAAAGLRNAIDQPRYPVLTNEQLLQLDTDMVLLPSEPYAFTPDHQVALQKQLGVAGKLSKVAVFNGENLFWSGPRALRATQELQALFLGPKGGADANACV